MPFGIWDPKGADRPGDDGQPQLPGTEQLLSSSQRLDVGPDAPPEGLKTVVYRGVETILVPQPSDDPNDPLIWPRWQKEVAFWVVFFNAIVFAIAPGPLMAPVIFLLAQVFGKELTEIAGLSGYQLLVVGACGPIVSVLAQKYGKRPQFLFAAAAATVGTAVCVAGAQQDSFHTLMAGRVVQGLGVTAWESLAVATVGDLYYLHERGLRTAVLVVALACTAALVSIISGAMSEGVGWTNLFVALLPVDVACLVATVFLLPETQFDRRNAPVRLVGGGGGGGGGGGSSVAKAADAEYVEQIEGPPRVGGRPPRKTYLQRLAPFSRGAAFTDRRLDQLLLAMVGHLANPAVWWILLVSGVMVSFFVVATYILSQIWSAPPYNLGTAANGFFYVGAFAGGVAAVGAGPLCDWSARRLARLHGGVFEAEFRIPVNLLGALCLGLGWFLFWWRIEHVVADGYYFASFCFGLVCFGVSVPSTSAGLYILDAFPRQATEIFVLQMMLKNFLFYGFSLFINTWAAPDPGEVFRVFGIASEALLALCIPMYIFGKVNRRFVHSVQRKYWIVE